MTVGTVRRITTVGGSVGKLTTARVPVILRLCTGCARVRNILSRRMMTVLFLLSAGLTLVIIGLVDLEQREYLIIAGIGR